MSTDRNCGNCRFRGAYSKQLMTPRLECRRNAPGPISIDSGHQGTLSREHVVVWPMVKEDDWCAEHGKEEQQP